MAEKSKLNRPNNRLSSSSLVRRRRFKVPTCHSHGHAPSTILSYKPNQLWWTLISGRAVTSISNHLFRIFWDEGIEFCDMENSRDTAAAAAVRSRSTPIASFIPYLSHIMAARPSHNWPGRPFCFAAGVSFFLFLFSPPIPADRLADYHQTLPAVWRRSRFIKSGHILGESIHKYLITQKHYFFAVISDNFATSWSQISPDHKIASIGKRHCKLK